MHHQGGRVARLTVGLGERYIDGDSTAGAGPAVHPALLWHRLLLALNCTLNSISILAVICAGRSNAESEMFELKVDGEKFAGEFSFVEFLNRSFTGPALPLRSMLHPMTD